MIRTLLLLTALCAASSRVLAAPERAAAPVQTAEQRRQANLQRLEKTLRDTLNWCDLTDKTAQDAVVECAVTQENALEAVREAHRKVAQTLLDKESRPAQIATLLNDWRAAVEDAKEQREIAIGKLKTRSGFLKNPKLESFLTITGLIGDEAGFIIGAEGHLLSTLGNLAAAPPK